MSFSVDVDDVGVSTGDWVSRLLPEGEAVPSLESLFFFDDLLSPFPRWSLVVGVTSARLVTQGGSHDRGQSGATRRKNLLLSD